MRKTQHYTKLNPSPITEPKSDKQQALLIQLAAIPRGSVTSYGQLAKAAGLGNAARWVAQQLKKLPDDTQLPWHRVISASGRISLPSETSAGQEQRRRLTKEGIAIINDRVDSRFFW